MLSPTVKIAAPRMIAMLHIYKKKNYQEISVTDQSFPGRQFMISKLSNAGWLSPTMKIAAPRNISHCSATAALQTVEVNLESIAMSLFDDIFLV